MKLRPPTPPKSDSSIYLEAGLAVTIDSSPGQEVTVIPNAKTVKAEIRFDRFIQEVIAAPCEKKINGNALVIACAIAFETLQQDDLLPFLEGLKDQRIYEGYAYVTWIRNGKINRREISALTRIAYQKCGPNVQWKDALKSETQSVLAAYDFTEFSLADRNLGTVFSDLGAWVYIHLPMPLVVNYFGVVRGTLLPEVSWQRRYGLEVGIVKSTPENLIVMERADSLVMQAVLENKNQLSGAWFVEGLRGICNGLVGPEVDLRDEVAHRKLLTRLEGLARQLMDVGPNEAVLLGWTMFIVREGSLKKKNPRLSRLAGYISSALRDIHTSLRSSGKHWLDLTANEFGEIYKTILSRKPESSTLKAAIASFHLYLQQTFDVERIGWLYKSLDREYQPRADMIWPHELEKISEILIGLTQDMRQIEQINLWLELLASAPMRFSELKWIHLCDVKKYADHYEVHVKNRRLSGSGKTKAADRSAFFFREQTIELLDAWCKRLELEECDPGNPIFEDPHNPGSLYKLAESYYLLNRCLKIATGQQGASTHLLRHTVLSNRVEHALLNIEKSGEVNVFHKIAVEAGHRSFETTLLTYAHLFERSMRYWTDRAIRSRQISHEHTAAWIEVTATSVRARKSRSRSSTWHGLDEIQKCSYAEIDEIKPPQIKKSTIATLPNAELKTFEQTSRILSDLFKGYSIGKTASRCGASTEYVTRHVGEIKNVYIRLCKPTASNTDSNEHLRYLELINRKVKFNFRKLNKSTWSHCLSIVQNLGEAEQTPLLNAWFQSARKGALHIPNATCAKQAIAGLKTIGIPLYRLIVRFDEKALNKRTGEGQLTPLELVSVSFINEYGGTPRLEKQRPSDAKTPFSIQILSGAPKKNQVAAPAANETGALNALLLIGHVHSIIQKGASACQN